MKRFLCFSRESRESRQSTESIRSNPSNPSILSRAGIGAAALLVAVSAQAGSDTAQSAAFRVDTRATTSVKVTGFASRWCDGAYGGQGRHVYFLEGVPLPVEFVAQVDWGDKTASRLEFNGVNNGLNYARSLNVGALGTGGKLEVVAVATDGTRSPAFRANFDVAPLPAFVNGQAFHPPLSHASELTYSTQPFYLKIFQGAGGTIQGVPLPDGAMNIDPNFNAEAVFEGSSGVLSIQVVAGASDGVKLKGTRRRRPDGKFGKAASVDFGLNVEGKVVAVWRQNAGAWAVNSGYLGLDVSGSYSTAPYYVYAPPPIYLRADISAQLAMGVRIQDLGDEQGWTPVFVVSSDGFPDVKGVLGCGVGKVFALEGYVGVSGKFELQSPPTVCTQLGVAGRIGAQIVLIGFATAPIDIWSGEYWIIGGTNPQGMVSPFALSPEAMPLKLTALDTRQFQPIGRDYLKRAAVRPLALALPTAQILALTGGTETTLMSDGYPYPEPAVAAAGLTNHVLYVRDNESRLAVNRTELVDVFNVGEGWSAPSAVWDDGTGDFAPQAAALPDGTLLAVWANGRAVLPEGASLDDALAGLEIAVGERNPVTGVWTCRNLTSNAYLDHSPMLAAAADGSAMAAWIRNRDLNPTGTPEEPNRILFSRRVSGIWEEEDYVAINLGTITYCDLVYNGTGAVLVFSMDADGDLATMADQELYGCTFSGGQWGLYTRLTSNSLQDTRPYVRYDAGGEVLVVWYQEGKIMSATGLALADPVEAGDMGLGSAAQDFKLATGAEGQMAVMWQGAGVEGVAASDPYILNYDPDQGLWSHGVRLLEDPALERGFSATFGESGNLILAYSKVEVGEDAEGVPVFGAVDLCVLDHPVGPDPAISQETGILLSTNSVVLGGSVDILVNVENRGDMVVTNLAVCIYEGDVLLGATQRVAQVLGGTSEVVRVTWTVPEAASNVVLRAVVDPGLETDDRNRANNVATLAALMPDLSVDGASALNETADVRLIRASVMNEGAVPVAAGAQVTFRRGASDGPLLAEDTLGALVFGTNGVYDAGFRWDMGGASFTSAFEVVYIAVDPANAVGEIDEGNNTAAVQVMTSLDSDSDGLLDGEEQRLGTRIDLADSDGDGLSDSAEVRTHNTNPLLKDSDGDGSNDGDEITALTDPNSATDVFKFVEADGSESYAAEVTWNAKSGGVYQVVAAPSVLGPWNDAPVHGGEFGQTLLTAVTNGMLRYRDTQTGLTNRFYRVKFVVP